MDRSAENTPSTTTCCFLFWQVVADLSEQIYSDQLPVHPACKAGDSRQQYRMPYEEQKRLCRFQCPLLRYQLWKTESSTVIVDFFKLKLHWLLDKGKEDSRNDISGWKRVLVNWETKRNGSHTHKFRLLLCKRITTHVFSPVPYDSLPASTVLER